MLPDETLRHETRQFTALNRGLLLGTLGLLAVYVLVTRLNPHWLDPLADFLTRTLPYPELARAALLLLDKASLWFLLLFVLLPLAMTMALIWKTKEVILDSVFNARG